MTGMPAESNRPIPVLPMPSGKTENAFIEEELVSVTDFFQGEIPVEPAYFRQGIRGASREQFVRRGAAEKLAEALRLLPDGLTFKVFDAFRPIGVQQALYDDYAGRIRAEHPEYSEEELVRAVSFFVSVPRYDPDTPSVHNTGGAIDLTIVRRKTGEELDMGTGFDDFTELSHTAYFEKHDPEGVIAANRRLLYHTMLGAGFTNLASEWWHYDYGTAFWAYYTGEKAKYRGLL